MLRPVTMEDDDVGIAGGIRCAGQRGDCLNGKALLRQFVGQESAIDHAILDEKDANGVRLAGGGEKRGRRCLQGHDILFKSGHLKLLPSEVCWNPKLGGRAHRGAWRVGCRLSSPATMLTERGQYNSRAGAPVRAPSA